jgi:hypothetical protein
VRALDGYDLLDRGGLSDVDWHVDVLARRNAEWWLFLQRRLSKLQTLQPNER